ncbi:MAG: MoxR family ATPase [Synergistaceae bacterium]|nr:MoxR family ATPase [Synergistaceae bacterium]
MDSFINIKNDEMKKIMEYLSKILHGKGKSIAKMLVCILSRGHILLEDLPGLGKTTIAIALAKALGLSFGRIQCTNDLLPGDITGLNILRGERGEFEFRAGPIFNNLVLVDEINRATPKTQSALLEAMGEEQTTIDGVTYNMPNPFITIATQNPAEHSGTFPLPESQIDRFMMKISIGYPVSNAEREILRFGSQREEIQNIKAVVSVDELLEMQGKIVETVKVSEKILDYVLGITDITRNHSDIEVGISTRGAMTLLQAARACAWIQNRDYVIHEDIKLIAADVLLHRLQFKRSSTAQKREVLKNIMFGITVF